MLENVRLAFQGIWSHKLRSFLTMLGIIIGIAAIIAIVSTIKGTNEQIKQNLIGSGNNAVSIQLYQEDWPYETTYYGIPDGIPTVSSETKDQILDLDNVEAAAVYNRRGDNYQPLSYQNSSIQGCEMFGIDSDYFPVVEYEIKRGRNFVSKDYTEYKPVMIIEDSIVKQLFSGENPIGKTVEYNSIAFVVVGVVEQKTEYEPVINSEEDYLMYMEYGTVGKVFIPKTKWDEVFAYDEPEEVVVKTSSTNDMSTVGKKAADILNITNTNPDVTYKAEDVLQTAANLQSLSSSTNNQLILIASISLVVGGIGVMNIMLVSVTERTREIGLKKAIGAKKKWILWQFLTEASVLTSIGGVLGVLAGIGLAQIMSSIADIPVAISIPAIILSVIFSMAVGIIFGLIPSVKAANLNPIDALRHE